MSSDPIRASQGSSSSQNAAKKRKRYETLEELFEKQDRADIERISGGYRKLLAKADETKADLTNRTLRDLRLALRDGDALFVDTRDTGLAALDAKLLSSTAESAVNMVRKMKTASSTFDLDEFLIRLGGELGLGRAERDDMSPIDELEDSQGIGPSQRYRKGTLGDWEKLGWMAAKFTKRVPGVEFMYGPLAVEHTKRAMQRRQRKASVGPEVRPQEIQSRKDGEGASSKPDNMVQNVIKVSKILQNQDKGEGVNLLQLVINPDDYGQTVENMFYASFLVKEGKAGIQVDEDGQIIIRDESANQIDEQLEPVKNQAVIELDMETWQEAKEVFNITTSMIPHRQYANTARPAAGTWYT